MGNNDNDSANDSVQYYTPSSRNEDDDIITPLVVFGSFIGLGYILNNYFFATKDMGEGRILNNHIRQYFHRLQNWEDLDKKNPYFQRQYRTHNVAYPDILYEGVTKQAKPDNAFVNYPMPASDDTMLTYAEPSNIVTDEILYEQGVPDIKEDYRLTGVIPNATARSRYNRRGIVRRTPGGIDAGASNTIITTEYNTGLNEKVRKDNPKVVETIMTPVGPAKVAKKRLAPIRPRVRRRFNFEYDAKGNLITKHKPVYDTRDALADLHLTNEDYGPEPGGKVSSETISAFEDFITKGRLREGYEIIPSED